MATRTSRSNSCASSRAFTKIDCDSVLFSADESLLPELTSATVIKAINKNDGDVLIFLPGEGEIKKCVEILETQLPGFAIHPLYGQLPQQQQLLAIVPNKFGKRKVVLATSIAETSLTIEGIRIVVDCGFVSVDSILLWIIQIIIVRKVNINKFIRLNCRS